MSASKEATSPSRPMTRKFWRAIQEKQKEAELETAANSLYENGITAQNRVASPLLSLPQDVTELLLEYVAKEPKAILNLRQVCTVTKGWVDFPLSPSQSLRIFSKIPVYLDLKQNDLQKFDSIPPPPSTCSLKLRVDKWCERAEHLKQMKSLRLVFPSFFTFWRKQMVTLSVRNYSSKLLNALGQPNALRELYCASEMSETHPSLLRLETIEFHEEPTSIRFFRHVARSVNLKRLSIKTSLYMDEDSDEDSDSDPCDQLERLQIVLDAKRNLGSDFQFDIHFDPDDYLFIVEDKLRQFLASLEVSTSFIVMFTVPNVFAEQVSSLLASTTTRSPIDNKDKVLQKFFNSIHSYTHKRELSEVSCLISKRHLLRNLKILYMDIPEEYEEEFKSSEQLIFPSGIESIEIVSSAGMLVPRNLPGSLRSLALQLQCSYFRRYRYTSGIEFVQCLSLISQSCPLLEKLRIKPIIISVFPFANTTTKDPYAFKKLKWLQLNGQIYIDPQTKNADGIKKTRLSEIFLFDILRVDQMSLLKFNFIIGGEEMDWPELDSGCIERLLESPLASSLTTLRLDCKVVTKEAKKSFKKLHAVVKENYLKWLQGTD